MNLPAIADALPDHKILAPVDGLPVCLLAGVFADVAWLRRVTEENVDLNRNFIDFAAELPANPGHDELADAFVPRQLSGPGFEAAEAKIAAYRKKHGESAFQVAIIDYHTGLGPFGYGEPICSHDARTAALERAKRWYGDSLTEPATGTSSSVLKSGLNEFGWMAKLGDKATFVALEYGTYTQESGRRALREDHWLHAYGKVDWPSPETQRIKRQVIHQALGGLAGAAWPRARLTSSRVPSSCRTSRCSAAGRARSSPTSRTSAA